MSGASKKGAVLGGRRHEFLRGTDVRLAKGKQNRGTACDAVMAVAQEWCTPVQCSGVSTVTQVPQ